MTEALRSLLERVEAAEGADREIDRLLQITLQTDFQFIPFDHLGRTEYLMSSRADDLIGDLMAPASGSSIYVGPFTASLDAAVGLVERMSGNWSDISGYKLVVREDSCDVEMWGGPEISCGRQKSWVVERNDRNLALALLAAMLRAVIAKEKT